MAWGPIKFKKKSIQIPKKQEFIFQIEGLGKVPPDFEPLIIYKFVIIGQSIRRKSVDKQWRETDLPNQCRFSVIPIFNIIFLEYMEVRNFVYNFIYRHHIFLFRFVLSLSYKKVACISIFWKSSFEIS